MPERLNRKDLSSGWSFKETDAIGNDAWAPVKKVPSVVHLDLLDNKK
jgi:beta-mannosidase